MGPTVLNPLSGDRSAPLVVVTMVTATTAISPPVLGMFAEEATAVSWLAMLFITGGLAALLARWAVRAKEAPGVFLRTVLGGFLAGWFNSVLCFIAWGSFSPRFGENMLQAVAMSPFVAIFGVAIGGPIGFAFGFALLIPALLVNRLRRRPGAEAADGCLVGAGSWALAVTGGLATLVLLGPELGLSDTAETLTVSLCGVTGTLALGIVVLASRRLWQRRAWLARVRAGLVPDWVVVPFDTWRAEELEGIEPLLVTAFPDAVLASARGEMGYREVRRLRPRALVAGS